MEETKTPVESLFTNKTLSMTLGPSRMPVNSKWAGKRIQTAGRNPKAIIFRGTDGVISKSPNQTTAKIDITPRNLQKDLELLNIEPSESLYEIQKIGVFTKHKHNLTNLNKSEISENATNKTELNISTVSVNTVPKKQKKDMESITDNSFETIKKVMLENINTPFSRTPLFGTKALQTFMLFANKRNSIHKEVGKMPVKFTLCGNSIKPFKAKIEEQRNFQKQILNRTTRCISINKKYKKPVAPLTTMCIYPDKTNTISSSITNSRLIPSKLGYSYYKKYLEKNIRHNSICSLSTNKPLRRIQRPYIQIARKSPLRQRTVFGHYDIAKEITNLSYRSQTATHKDSSGFSKTCHKWKFCIKVFFLISLKKL